MDSVPVQDALIMIHQRNAFYKRKYHFLLVILMFCVCLTVMLGGMIFYLYKHPSSPYYFAVDNVGRLVPYVETKDPNMSLQDVTDWTVEAVETAQSYDFVNFRSQFQNAEKYFTEYGWRNYMSGLDASNNLVALTKRKMIVVAKIVSKPELLNQGIIGGAYAWKFKMAMLITYMMPPYSEESQFQNAVLVTAIVQRQKFLTSYKGLGVVKLSSQLVVAPTTGALPPLHRGNGVSHWPRTIGVL